MDGRGCCELDGKLPEELIQAFRKVCVKTLASRLLDEMISLLPTLRSRYNDLIKFAIKSANIGCADPYLIVPKLAILYLGKDYEVESASINAWDKSVKPILPIIEKLDNALRSGDLCGAINILNELYSKRSWAYDLIHEIYP